ncbi:MAG: hypothetical protein ACFB2X_02830 [Rivularia sp. (in: cyanobacteria)]
MKVVPKVFLITLIASVVGLVGCNENLLPEEDTKSSNSSLIIEKSTVDESITLLLPQVVVQLKQGKSKSGWLTQFSSQKKQIVITLSGYSQTIKFADIKKLQFVLYKAPYSSPDILVRNEKQLSKIKQETWAGIPINHFQLRKNRTDEASIKLSSYILSKFGQIRTESSYIVETIEFDESLQKMTFKVLLQT